MDLRREPDKQVHMTSSRTLRCLMGILVAASLLMAPLGGHADQPAPETTGVLAALSATCLDLDGGSDDGLEHDATACHACPFGCFGSSALACASTGMALSYGKSREHVGDRPDRTLATNLNTVKARSPPAA
jgi:hypothetical protein